MECEKVRGIVVFHLRLIGFMLTTTGTFVPLFWRADRDVAQHIVIAGLLMFMNGTLLEIAGRKSE